MSGFEIVKGSAIAGLAMLWSSAALADAIDGDWCSTTEVKQFHIEGSKIVTPAGTQTTGKYSRHAFSYIVPVGDPGAGAEIAMQLLNEEEVRVFVEKEEPKVWRRCELIS
jgi:hypothetical protein